MILAEWAAIAVENARLYRSVPRASATSWSAPSTGSRRRPRSPARSAARPTSTASSRSIVKRGARPGRRALAADPAPRRRRAGGRRRRRRVHRGTSATRGSRSTASITGAACSQRGRASASATSAPALRLSLDRHGLEASSGAPRPARSSAAQALGVLAAFDRLGRGRRASPEDERLLQGFAASAATAVANAQSVAERTDLRESLAGDRARARALGAGAARRDAAEPGRPASCCSPHRRGDPRRRRLAGEAIDAAVDQIAGRDRRDARADRRAAARRARRARPRRRRSRRSAERARPRRRRDRGRASTSTSTTRPARTRRAWCRELEDTVYRLVQEALNNAVTHAEAQRSDRGRRARGHGDGRVADDGKGFDPAAQRRLRPAGDARTGRARRRDVGGHQRAGRGHQCPRRAARTSSGRALARRTTERIARSCADARGGGAAYGPWHGTADYATPAAPVCGRVRRVPRRAQRDPLRRAARRQTRTSEHRPRLQGRHHRDLCGGAAQGDLLEGDDELLDTRYSTYACTEARPKR